MWMSMNSVELLILFLIFSMILNGIMIIKFVHLKNRVIELVDAAVAASRVFGAIKNSLEDIYDQIDKMAVNNEITG